MVITRRTETTWNDSYSPGISMYRGESVEAIRETRAFRLIRRDYISLHALSDTQYCRVQAQRPTGNSVNFHLTFNPWLYCFMRVGKNLNAHVNSFFSMHRSALCRFWGKLNSQRTFDIVFCSLIIRGMQNLQIWVNKCICKKPNRSTNIFRNRYN